MFDLIIIGGGPAGYYAAEKAGAEGMSALLIEKNQLGGVCLNEGCIPSKMLLHSAKLFTQAKTSEAYGVSSAGVSFDLSTIMARKQKIVAALRSGIAGTLKKNRVTMEQGLGLILPRTGDTFRVQVADTLFEGKRLLLCTGAEAIRLPLPGADQPFVYTNKEILAIDVLPKNLAVIGAGAIGLELAVFFAEAGGNVTIIELLPAIGGGIDKEAGAALKRDLEKKGIRFILNARVREIGDHAVLFECEGAEATAPADIVLLSVGRRPITQGFGLENCSVAVERGAIVTDGQGRTSVKGIWAAGDVNGKSMLAHTAYREAHVCIDDMRGKNAFVNYDAIPGVIYTHPEVAFVGLTQEEAERRSIAVVCAKLPLSYNGRYYAENEGGRGLCKVVIDKESRTLLGVHIVGGNCSEMIFGAAAMIERKMTIDDINGVVFPHPTVSEIIKDTIRQVQGM